MKCGKIREEWMEALLGGEELANSAVQDHLATCTTCAEEVSALRRTMTLLDEWQAPEPSPYFSTRLRARMREDHVRESVSWWSWVRRPAVATAGVGLIALGVGLLGGVHLKRPPSVAENNPPAVVSTAATDLLYLDNHADLFADFDALDDDQTETN
jgi:anti-sigma factor RsiW